MKIMYVVNSCGAGGAERHLLSLVSHMVEAGHSVLVVALTESVTGGAKNLGDDFISAGAAIVFLDHNGVSWLNDVRRWFRLLKLARAWAPDILHSHLPRADFAASLVKRILPGVIWICTVHDAYIKGVYSGYWVFRWLGWNWRLADHLIAVSGHAQRWALETLRISTARMSIIYHGIKIPPADFKLRPSVARPFVIGCLARFESRKGIASLIKAMVTVCEKYPDTRLVIAGSDPAGYANEMRRLADSLNIMHAIDIRKFCYDPFNFLRSLDVFAFPSFSEGFGIVLLEAMSVGLPIVANDCYPLNYIVVNGQTGILANSYDPETFAHAIIKLIENPELLSCMGQAGYRRCGQEFSEEKMIRSIENLYQSLYNRRATCDHSSKQELEIA